MIVEQPRLLTVPMVALMPIEGAQDAAIGRANALLVAWGHRLGPIDRPFGMQAFTLDVAGRPIAVAVSASIISETVAGYRRGEVVELARQAAEPGNHWANRVLLRLWREVCAPQWPYWAVRAAISYSKNSMHRGEMYRLDGWTKVREDAGSSGGGAWSRTRTPADSTHGPKTLWVWRYPEATSERAQGVA